MAGDPRVAGLEDFLADRGAPLLRAAMLLTGSSEAGEDLLQAALERLLRHWRKVEGDPEAYLRRTIYNLAADGWRRQRRWRARLPLLLGADAGIAPDHSDQFGQRDELVRLLRRLPPGQRAAIVLRYCEDLTDAQAADVLGCSAGAVRSIDPATYLPVRTAFGLTSATPLPMLIPLASADIRWLAPTRANLALLTVPIPPGFRHVQTPP